jgi:hypothetical protein
MIRGRELTMPRPSAVAIALGVLCLGALGIATNIATSALPPAWSPYLWLAWLAMPVLLGAAAVIEVRRSQVGSGEGGADSPSARDALLRRVHRNWVRGVLEQSLYHEARIELGMTVTVDAPYPWDVVVVSPDGSSRVVAPGTTTLELLDRYASPSWRGRLHSPTVRASLICGLAGWLLLGAAGLTVYGWRGGLAGAVIGAAVGLPCDERIDTFNFRIHRTRAQGQGMLPPCPELASAASTTGSSISSSPREILIPVSVPCQLPLASPLRLVSFSARQTVSSAASPMVPQRRLRCSLW